MLGNRASQHNFAAVPAVHNTRSQFDRSFTVKDTMDFDYLNPILVDEIIPGDTINLNLASFARLATQKVPIMDNMYIDFFFFFVPNRLLWTNWEKFCGAQDNPGDSTSYTIPTVTLSTGTGADVGSIYDKMGIPTGIDNLVINALPLRAYNLIYNEWFRDELLQNSITKNVDDGPDADTEYVLKKRGKRHDYFTSCTPSPQKGTSVSLPLGTTAPIVTTGNAIRLQRGVGGTKGTMVWSDTSGLTSDTDLGNTGDTLGFADDNSSLLADLTNATAATINQLRQAFSVQSIYELDNRGGTRYVELLNAHYGVVSPDFRLQRPEFLGSGKVQINSHPVAQMSPTSGSNAQGQLAAFATASTSGAEVGFTKSFVEHGYIIGMACARADITYQQGLNKIWSRSTRFDFFWPKLQEIGEQAVLNKEIYCQGPAGGAADDSVFGYQERFAEYRFKPSEIRGKFRSTYSTSIDQWHLAEEFGSAPALNSTFITQSTPIDRAIAINTEPHLLIDMWFQYKHARPMLAYSIPSTLGRF